MIKKTMIALCTMFMISCFSGANVLAEKNDISCDEYNPRRVQVINCPNCPTGVIPKEVVRTTSTFAHYEAFPCSHGTHTYDIYRVYEVKGYARCTDCGYEMVISQTEDHQYDHCSNSLPR